jgi:hypothetical protein
MDIILIFKQSASVRNEALCLLDRASIHNMYDFYINFLEERFKDIIDTGTHFRPVMEIINRSLVLWKESIVCLVLTQIIPTTYLRIEIM